MEQKDQKDKTIHRVTYCAPLPAGQTHPTYFDQHRTVPDPTDVFDVHEELSYTLYHILTLANVLYDRATGQHEKHHDREEMDMFQMITSFAEEAKGRAVSLRNAGMYWQGEIDDRNDGSFFPDLPAPAPRPTQEKTQ